VLRKRNGKVFFHVMSEVEWLETVNRAETKISDKPIIRSKASKVEP